MPIYKKLAICLLAAAISNFVYAVERKPMIKISNPFAGHMDIKLLGMQKSKQSGMLLKLEFTKYYEINAKDPLGRGDSSNRATAHKLCYQTASVDLKIKDANNKYIGSTTVEIPEPGQGSKIVEVSVKNLSRYQSPINLKFDCTPYRAD